jgi:hypothetical protein
MFEGIQGVFLSIYMIGALITLGGVMLLNAAETANDFPSIPLSKGLWITAFWFIAWVIIFWEIYKVNRDGA